MSIVQKEMIYSLSSGPGRAGLSVFRLSGEGAYAAALKLTGRRKLTPRYAHLALLTDKNGAPVDEALTIYFPAPHSFTGEDVAEFHCHGSPAVCEAMARALSGLGARQAEAGEFTRRAVLNGRMDLTEAEGLADLIESETSAQQQQALRQMQGGLRDIYSGWKERLLDALAQIEGEIDFPDEGDIPDGLSHKADPVLREVLENMQKQLEQFGRGARVRRGISVTLFGAPNTGKSSIINRLAGDEVAIVTDKAGTTRDIVTANIVMAGLPVTLSDTAGLRLTEDVIEEEGVRRARARASESDLRIWVVDGEAGKSGARPPELRGGDLLLINKIDKTDGFMVKAADDLDIHRVSALTGEGFRAFQDALEDIIKLRFAPLGAPGLTRERHRGCVERAAGSVERSLDALGRAPELAGEDIRRALQAIRELAGDADIESVFDRIFTRFCVGK